MHSTCALSRVVMGRWDQKWKSRMVDNNVKIEDDGRFVDDARAFLYAIRAGWRWEKDGLWYRREWEAEDTLLSPMERTRKVVQGSMGGLTQCLKFTTETSEEFADGWLPTLGFKLRVSQENNIQYCFFEKPTAPNRCLQAETALNHNSMMKSLANEVERRMDMISSTVPALERVAVINTFSQKLINSGHKLKTVRDIICNGLKGYKRKVARCLKNGSPIHRSATQSAKSRRTKKLLAKSNWFRSEQEDVNELEREFRDARENRQPPPGVSAHVQSSKKTIAKLRTSTVMFVEFSKGGGLQKRMKEVLDRLAPMLGFRVRVTEKGGSSLGSLLSNKHLWSGVPCGRGNCRPCAQPEDKKEPCKARNIVYESECTWCNEPGSRKLADKEGLRERKEQANLYVGETARSISERAGEHWEGAMGGKEENHMLEHLAASHEDHRVPSFRFRVVKKCRTALERQVREAVRIEMRGNVLNKKGMFNRCKLTRMIVDREWDKEVWEAAWVESPEEELDMGCMKKSGKSKLRAEEKRPTKRAKREDEEGIVWGEQTSQEDKAREEFLKGAEVPVAKAGQTELKVFTGVEWMTREILKECSHRAVEWSELVGGLETWEDWNELDGVEDPQKYTRTEKEEKYLWARLEELDKEMHKSELRQQAKKQRVITKARKKMGAGKRQPSIHQMIEKMSGKPASQMPAKPTIQKPIHHPYHVPGSMGADKHSMDVPRPDWKSSQGGGTYRGSVTISSPKAQNPGESKDVESASKAEIANPKASRRPGDAARPDSGVGGVNTPTGSESNNVYRRVASLASVSQSACVDGDPCGECPNMGKSMKTCKYGDVDGEISDKFAVDVRCEVNEPSRVPPKPVKLNDNSRMSSENSSSFAEVLRKNGGCKKLTVKIIQRGKFEITTTNGSPASRKKISNHEISMKLATPEKTTFSKESKHAFSTVKYNASVGQLTPTKRKMLEGGGEVKSLACIFENNDITKPTWREVNNGASPAKRQRCARGSK